MLERITNPLFLTLLEVVSLQGAAFPHSAGASLYSLRARWKARHAWELSAFSVQSLTGESRRFESAVLYST